MSILIRYINNALNNVAGYNEAIQQPIDESFSPEIMEWYGIMKAEADKARGNELDQKYAVREYRVQQAATIQLTKWCVAVRM